MTGWGLDMAQIPVPVPTSRIFSERVSQVDACTRAMTHETHLGLTANGGSEELIVH